jgi:GT2 family glycosyltransferase
VNAPRATVVIATRNRRPELLQTLGALSEVGAPVVVVDNGSDDGTAAAVRREYRSVHVVELPENHGAAGRTIGARLASTPYVAFADDDSTWPRASLECAADLLDARSELALVAAQVLVGRDARVDPLSQLMDRSPLGALPYDNARRVLGFMACAAVVRREAFLDVGGFLRRFVIGGEEALVALDLRSNGWELAYVPDVVAHHHPASRDADALAARRHLIARNALWTAWLRYPLDLAGSVTADVLRQARSDATARDALKEALQAFPWVVRKRRPVPALVRRELAVLRRAGMLAAVAA